VQVWNFGFQQAGWVTALANASVLRQGDPYRLNYLSESNEYYWANRLTAYNAAVRIPRIFAGVFGAGTARPLTLDSRLGSIARSDLEGGADWVRGWIDWVRGWFDWVRGGSCRAGAVVLAIAAVRSGPIGGAATGLIGALAVAAGAIGAVGDGLMLACEAVGGGSGSARATLTTWRSPLSVVTTVCD
jgi:hypothetical protein